MKGLRGVDPQQEPSHDLVVLLAAIGWIIALAYVLDWCLDWLMAL